MMSYRKAQWLFQILSMCCVITHVFYLCLSFFFSLCHKHTHTLWHNLRKQYWKPSSLSLGFVAMNLLQLSLSPLSTFSWRWISPQTPAKQVSSSSLKSLQSGLFLHLSTWTSSSSPKTEVVLCSPTVFLLWRFLTQNRNLTLALCSPQPGFWNLG